MLDSIAAKDHLFCLARNDHYWNDHPASVNGDIKVIHVFGGNAVTSATYNDIIISCVSFHVRVLLQQGLNSRFTYCTGHRPAVQQRFESGAILHKYRCVEQAVSLCYPLGSLKDQFLG